MNHIHDRLTENQFLPRSAACENARFRMATVEVEHDRNVNAIRWEQRSVTRQPRSEFGRIKYSQNRSATNGCRHLTDVEQNKPRVKCAPLLH
jgi:hypothetical protein